ncbi:uncharacterized protein LOC111791185 [Cucurbita pepo subsp. pepo]|uniref:uncharacterized protein LOC111791185 n=1 Tax=Cucurbita pepo subsp. pepo TaxID=3664 RepID=UPI000C9D741F|nr:uncharacterized protein LOC111791185 [Cucurbita pepo subsp. pepo]
MANPSGNHHEASQPSSSFDGGNPSNGNSTHVPVADNSSSAIAMKHNPGISTDWTSDEQVTLEEGLKKYAAESSVIRYAKIAMQLPNKTVRDVALRCRWMNKKENSKRRKEEHNLSRKNKDKKERVSEPSMKSARVAARPNVPPYGMPMIPMDNDDGVSFKAIGGTTGDLLEQNAHAMNQISSNLASFQIQDNIGLFCQTRDNILKIMSDLNEMPEVMKQMPPLPVKVNDELANTILPPTAHSMQ